MTIEDEVQQFVIAVRVLSRRYDDQAIRFPSWKSMTKLRLQIEEQLENKKMRVPVLAAITGLPITSSKQLCQPSVSTLIDQTLEERKGEHIIKYIEDNVRKGIAQDPIGFKPWNLYPWEKG